MLFILDKGQGKSSVEGCCLQCPKFSVKRRPSLISEGQNLSAEVPILAQSSQIFVPKSVGWGQRHQTMSSGLQCVHCGRNNFATTRSLTQHQRQNAACAEMAKAAMFGLEQARTSAPDLLFFATVGGPLQSKKGGGSNVLPQKRAIDDAGVPLDELEYGQQFHGSR